MKFSQFLLFLAVVGAAAYGAFFLGFANRKNSNLRQEKIFQILPGEGFSTIAHHLQKERLVRNAHLFRILGIQKGIQNQLKAGDYVLRTDQTPEEIADTLVSGQSILLKITVPEGHHIFEIAELLDSQGIAPGKTVLSLSFDPAFIRSALPGDSAEKNAPFPASLEGYLFPETYKFSKFTGAKQILEMMIKNALRTYQELLLKPPTMPIPLSRHQVFTLASLIEKETGAPEERPAIASVFYNRLRKGMRLQTDPTILYGKTLQTGKTDLRISRADLTQDNLYNTYTRSGLPPGPIASPGKESLEAALRPARTDYLYFVSHNNGTHHFSKSLEEHNMAVRRFQLDPNARKNHSWRELQKTKGKSH